jgi:hypothetical protein
MQPGVRTLTTWLAWDPATGEDGEDESESEAKSSGRKSESLIMWSLCNICASGVIILGSRFMQINTQQLNTYYQ